MGWTVQIATHYKGGRIDRKAECDAYFLAGLNAGHYEVLKSTLRGSIYYAAVRCLKEYEGRDKNGNPVYKDIEGAPVWAAVFLTSTEGAWFYYKDMDESMGPCECDCPASILSLLSETDSEWANEWRRRCYENIERQKSPTALKNLPIGAVIRFSIGDRQITIQKMAPNGQFRRVWWYVPANHTYLPARRIPQNYEVVTA